MTDRLTEVHRALAAAPADLVVERFGAERTRAYGTTWTERLQVGYRLAALVPLPDGDPVVGADSPAWRCFDHQSEVVDDAVVVCRDYYAGPC